MTLPGVTDRYGARCVFFETIRRVATDCTEALAALLPLYAAVAVEPTVVCEVLAAEDSHGGWALRERAVSPHDWGDVQRAADTEENWEAARANPPCEWIADCMAENDIYCTQPGRFREAVAGLHAWGERFHLADPWLLESAWVNLAGWHQDPECARGRDFVYPGHVGRGPRGVLSMSGIGLPSLLSDDYMDVFGEDRTARYLWRLHRQHPEAVPDELKPPEAALGAQTKQEREAARKAHEERIKALYHARGWEPVKQRRDRTGGPLVHFEWLVRFQVGKTSEEALAKQYRVTKGAVSQGVTEAADLVGVTLRAPLPGRAKWHTPPGALREALTRFGVVNRSRKG